MNKKTILIAPNSFKECADSVTISNIIYSNLAAKTNLQLIKKPLSDGGDGFLAVCESNFNLKLLDYYISKPYSDEKFLCQVGYDESNKIIYIESASVLGMKIIPQEKRHPINLSSKGMGELLLQISEDVNFGKIIVNKAIIGIGGTGTNDLGVGLAAEFGFELFDLNNNKLEPIPANFTMVGSIKEISIELPFQVELIIDVDNPLLGKNGATLVYGRQKGSTLGELKIIESGFEKLVNLFYYNKIIDSSKLLSGAGGGLAAGFQIFFNATLIQSDKFIAERLKLKEIENVDFIITGEGAFDEQSLMKKATGSIIDLYEYLKIPVMLICGKIDKKVKNKLPDFVKVLELIEIFGNEESSIKNFEVGIKTACEQVVKLVKA